MSITYLHTRLLWRRWIYSCSDRLGGQWWRTREVYTVWAACSGVDRRIWQGTGWVGNTGTENIYRYKIQVQYRGIIYRCNTQVPYTDTIYKIHHTYRRDWLGRTGGGWAALALKIYTTNEQVQYTGTDKQVQYTATNEQVQHTDTVYRCNIQVQYTGAIYRHNIQVQYKGAIYTGIMYRCNIQVQSISAMYRYMIQA